MRGRDEFDPQFKLVRDSVILRDGSRCVKCGHAKNLEVHHVNGYEDVRLEFLRTLCYQCHLIAPMGEEYATWEASGKSGWDTAIEHLRIPAKPELVREWLEMIDDYNALLRTGDLRGARQRKKELTGRCEGRKPFGFRPGEDRTLHSIREMRRAGKTLSEIAEILNSNDTMPSRTGKPWTAATLSPILKRISQQDGAGQ
jgi:hypothetical protein